MVTTPTVATMASPEGKCMGPIVVESLWVDIAVGFQ